jgi:hypothetical protein
VLLVFVPDDAIDEVIATFSSGNSVHHLIGEFSGVTLRDLTTEKSFYYSIVRFNWIIRGRISERSGI